MGALRQITSRGEFPDLMRELFGDRNVCAEIGVAEGRFIRSWLALPECYNVYYLIDPWRAETFCSSKATPESMDRLYLQVKASVAQYPKIQVMRVMSKIAAEAIKDMFTFVYIDALHEYENVREDIELWWPKIVYGGVLAGHDIHLPGVLKAVEEHCKKENVFFMKASNENDCSWYILKPVVS